MFGAIFLISTLNLVAGFAVAAELGRRSRRRAAALSSEAATPAAANIRPRAREAEPSWAKSLPTAVAPPAPPAGSPSVVGVLMERLASASRTYQEEVGAADERLRQCIREPHREELAACLGSLSQANECYLKEEQAWRADFEAAAERQATALQDRLLAALDIQGGQIASTQRLVREFNLDGDLQAEGNRVLQETHRLALASHKVRDTAQEELHLSGHQNQSAGGEGAAPGDRLTGLPTRAALDAAVEEWLSADSAQRGPACLAVFDIDSFGTFNERHGQRCGDRTLLAFGTLLAEECPEGALVARTGGGTFAALLRNHDIRQAAQFAERLRQIVEQATFEYRGTRLQLTTSCGIVEGGPSETVKSLLERSEQTLREAKRYGRNRCFVHEGRYPTPVVPPSFELEPRNLIV